jgi:hypothetical protein
MENAVVLHDPNVSLSLQKVADGLFKSGMFPNAKNAFGAFAIVEYGHELGIPPMMSLKNINIISGQLACNAQLMLSMAMSRGVTYKVVKETDKGAEILFKRGDSEYNSTFTEEDAKNAGLTGKDNWKKYGRDMYFWRCVAKGIRRIAPDAVLGLYTKDEISNGEIVDIGTPEIKATVKETPQVEETKIVEPEQPTQAGGGELEQPQENIIFATLKDITTKSGKTNGKDWTLYSIITDNGDTYGTFDETVADKASTFIKNGELARIEFKITSKGNKEVVELAA